MVRLEVRKLSLWLLEMLISLCCRFKAHADSMALEGQLREKLISKISELISTDGSIGAYEEKWMARGFDMLMEVMIILSTQQYCSWVTFICRFHHLSYNKLLRCGVCVFCSAGAFFTTPMCWPTIYLERTA